MTEETQENVHSDEPVEVETTEETTTEESTDSSESSDELAKAQKKIIDLKRENKELKKPSEETEVKTEAKPSKGELDFGQLAFHNSKTDSLKIESEEDQDFLKETMAETGKSQEAILKSTWFASELAERQEKSGKATANKKATPTKTRRSVPTGKDDIAYWMDKPFGDVPQKLRGKVLDAKVAEEDNPFSTE